MQMYKCIKSDSESAGYHIFSRIYDLDERVTIPLTDIPYSAKELGESYYNIETVDGLTYNLIRSHVKDGNLIAQKSNYFKRNNSRILEFVVLVNGSLP